MFEINTNGEKLEDFNQEEESGSKMQARLKADVERQARDLLCILCSLH